MRPLPISMERALIFLGLFFCRPNDRRQRSKGAMAMKIRTWVHVVAVASLVGAGAAVSAWAGGDTVIRSENGAAVQSYDNDSTYADNSVQGWAADTAATNGGVIREDVFLDEMGRRFDANPDHTGMRSIYLDDLRARWEAVDPGNQGLSPAEVGELTGNVDSSAEPSSSLSGSEVQPGNMGPGNMKGQ
jgi:hypothetical protein